MQEIGVVGAGTMGHGIAQVAAMSGQNVRMYDAFPGVAAKGLAAIRANLDQGVAKGKVDAATRDAALGRITVVDDLAALAGADLVVEAILERLDAKRALFGALAAIVSDRCVLATNTSSLSIATIADAATHPERVIGAHFFNPVFLMALLEIVRHPGTAPEIVEAVRAWGESLGKTCIIVHDVPGFATSRLGVCLGMEAIRMVEQGVASPQDIDTAMVLGYRHPVGPLKLTDLVGLDVRLAIGEYLARELGNPAFEPPALMRKMVAEGQLGKKSGRGFYDW